MPSERETNHLTFPLQLAWRRVFSSFPSPGDCSLSNSLIVPPVENDLSGAKNGNRPPDPPLRQSVASLSPYSPPGAGHLPFPFCPPLPRPRPPVLLLPTKKVFSPSCGSWLWLLWHCSPPLPSPVSRLKLLPQPQVTPPFSEL